MDNLVLRISGTFKVPIELMWEVWTHSEHVVNWWGPEGFTNSIHKMDFRVDGEWKLSMHGPNGINYPNRSIFREIIPHEKIVFEHFNPHFITTVSFKSKGEESQIEWTLHFDSAEMRETLNKAQNAEEGQKQNMKKLEKYLSALTTRHNI